METLFIYIAKSSGLIALFYIAYYFLLRKETFFTANRWFLLAGLFTSLILPWIVFTTIVWVEPAPTNFDWSKLPMRPVQEESFEINWYIVLATAYTIGAIIFLIRFLLDFYQLNYILKGKTAHNQADHKFIDTEDNIAPFSYFNTIVYNSSLYSEAEMESILEHEKVHSEQYHTIDVLITRFFCILFWFNPFIWLYKKAILQNLEFIADSEATKNISDKKAYQLTLLKITTHENCVVLTNHFYQSLIKKRIIMLNKNQSKKWNSWKYILIIPALTAFVFLFQIETIAQEKGTSSLEDISPKKIESIDVFTISKNSTEAEFIKIGQTLKDKFDITTTISEFQRNSKAEITLIQIKLNDKNGITKVKKAVSSKGIEKIGITVISEKDGKFTFHFSEAKPANSNANKNPKDVKIRIKNTQTSNINNDIKDNSTVNTNVSTDVNTNISTTTTVNSSSTTVTVDGNTIRITGSDDNIKPIIVLNGTITPNIDVKDIDVSTLISVSVLKGSNVAAKYKVGENVSVIKIETDSSLGK